MELVVTLALVVLVAVFLFSLWMLVVTCQRRRRYNRLIESQSQQQLRFSKLRQENLDDIGQLGPHISQTLDRNQWVEELATGLLQHCVAVLKLCHSLTERMAKIPLDSQQPELNELICKATTRVMPRFEALLRAMADHSQVDIRVLEARVGALVSACWALAAPAMTNPKHKPALDELIGEMDNHLQELQLALDKFEEDQRQLATTIPSVQPNQQQQQPSTSAHSQPQHLQQNHHQTQPPQSAPQRHPLLRIESPHRRKEQQQPLLEDGHAMSRMGAAEEALPSPLPNEQLNVEVHSSLPMADEAPADADPAIT